MRSDRSSGPAVRRVAVRRAAPLVAVLALGAAVAVPSGSASPAALARATPKAATAKQTSCAPFSRQVKRTTGAKRRTAKRQLARCKATNKATKVALPAIRDGRYVGTRGDGAEVDWTFCANGRYLLRTTTGSGTGVSSGSGWRVRAAETRGSTLTAIAEDPKKRLSVGFRRVKGAWKVGVSRSDDSVESIGAATRTDATAACAAGLPTQ